MKTKRTVAWLLLACCFLGIGFFALRKGSEVFWKSVYPLKYKEIVEQAADENGLDEAFVYAVIKAESDFDPDAVSHAGAIGLMQITPDTFEWLQMGEDQMLPTEELLDPLVNITYGCKFLARLLESFHDPVLAICAYNAGINRVKSWLEDGSISKDGKVLDTIPYPETENYALKVQHNYEIYRKLYF